jgi:hypothetical protein
VNLHVLWYFVAIPTRKSNRSNVLEWFQTYPPLADYRSDLPNDITNTPNGRGLFVLSTDELKTEICNGQELTAQMIHACLHGMCVNKRLDDRSAWQTRHSVQ